METFKPRPASSPRRLALLAAVLLAPWTAMPASDLQESLPFELPPDLYAAPGVECNLYLDNLVLSVNPDNYAFDVDCPKGRQDRKRWHFIPTEKDVGDFALDVKVVDSANHVVASGRSWLHVAPPDAGAGTTLNLLILGDSLTDASVYPKTLHDLLAALGNPKASFLGTNWWHGKGGNLDVLAHEGYAGWTWGDFLSRWEEGSPRPYRSKSKFLVDRGGKRELDFQAYCDKWLRGRKPDYITVFLGANEMFGASDAKLEENIDQQFANADKLIAEFKRVAPNVEIGLALLPPPASSQDAFGANYGCGLTRWQYRQRQFRLVQRQLEKFGGGQGAISLIPVFTGLDCENNYPEQSGRLNLHNPKETMRQCNALHPAREGYEQIGDIFYSWLKYRLALKAKTQEVKR